MDRDRWQKIKEILTGAENLRGAELASYLDAACDSNTPLQEEVRSFLGAEADRLAFLEHAAFRFEDPPERYFPGDRVGPYRILREVGRGGIGQVFLAERSDGQYHKRVALKLLKRGMDTDQILKHFVIERQILANLEHPYLCKFLDGGTTPDGLPFFVMEYVEGHTIDRFCGERGLDLNSRLRLFIKVCEAVSFAHRNLVIHRDIKPGNILVTQAGEPKLLDFGIAKLLSGDAGTQKTTTGPHRWMTPRYAAPEQVRGETITTAADIYSLGVLLYELLTGFLPLPGSGHGVVSAGASAPPAGPLKPSEAIKRAAVTPRDVTGVAAPGETGDSLGRVGDWRRFRRGLRGDLDNIVLKALREKPAERYASVDHFAEDISRHLAGFPVQARRELWTYRLAKFVRRHRLAVVTGSAVLLMLMGFLALVLAQRVQLRRERDTAETVLAFFLDSFKLSDPTQSNRGEVTFLEVLERCRGRLQEALTDQPKVQARLAFHLGQVYVNLGQYEPARQLLEQALETQARHLGETHEDYGETLEELGLIGFQTSQFQESEKLLRRVLALRSGEMGSQHVKTAEIKNHLGLLLRAVGKLEEAEALLREALPVMRRELGRDHPAVASNINNLATVLQVKGDTRAAESYYLEALDIGRRQAEPNKAQLANLLSNLALLLNQDGRFAEAETHCREALLLKRNLYGENHPEMATTLGILGFVLYGNGDYDRAVAVQLEAMAINQRVFGESHPRLSSDLNNLSHLYFLQGDLAEAGLHARQAVCLNREHQDPWFPGLAVSLYHLGRVACREGDLDEARALLDEAASIYRKSAGDRHRWLARFLVTQSRIEAAAGHRALALSLLEDSLSMRLELFKPNHLEVARSHLGFGLFFRDGDQWDRAEFHLSRALAIREAFLNPNHPQVTEIRIQLAELRKPAGQGP